MKVNVETKFKPMETAYMKYFGENNYVEVDIERVNISIDGSGLMITYDIQMGIDIYHNEVSEDMFLTKDEYRSLMSA